jgi:hypothetical protein
VGGGGCRWFPSCGTRCSQDKNTSLTLELERARTQQQRALSTATTFHLVRKDKGSPPLIPPVASPRAGAAGAATAAVPAAATAAAPAVATAATHAPVDEFSRGGSGGVIFASGVAGLCSSTSGSGALGKISTRGSLYLTGLGQRSAGGCVTGAAGGGVPRIALAAANLSNAFDAARVRTAAPRPGPAGSVL